MSTTRRAQMRQIDEVMRDAPLSKTAEQRIRRGIIARVQRNRIGAQRRTVVAVVVSAGALMATLLVVRFDSGQVERAPLVRVTEEKTVVEACSVVWTERETFSLATGCIVRPFVSLSIVALEHTKITHPSMNHEPTAINASPQSRGGSPSLGIEDGRVLVETTASSPNQRYHVVLPSATLSFHDARVEIEVAGTMSSVEVQEGSVICTDSMGTQRLLLAGQSHKSSLASTSHSVSSGSTKRFHFPAKTLQLDETIRRIEALRAQGRYSQALRLLDRLMASTKDPRTIEILSFERGTLLEAAGENVCAHWKRHIITFPHGVYAYAIEQRLSALKCSMSRKLFVTP